MLRALLPPESANEAEIEKEKNAEKSESGGKSKAAGPTGKKRKADGAVEIPEGCQSNDPQQISTLGQILLSQTLVLQRKLQMQMQQMQMQPMGPPMWQDPYASGFGPTPITQQGTGAGAQTYGGPSMRPMASMPPTAFSGF
eukprot:g11140.t1